MVKNNTGLLVIFLTLIKVTVTLPVTFLSIAGFYIYSGGLTWSAWIAALGVFLLSASSSAWNQVMEQHYDLLMERTRKRPIPANKITPSNASVIATVLFIAGSLSLLSISFLAFLLGFLAVIWYLFVYTLLKRKTAFATVPGALTGALPLVIGWVSAGGYLFSPPIIILGGFVLLWQIPHFWLLMIVYNDDYKKGGYPVLTYTFSLQNLKLWTLAWILSLVILGSLIPFFLRIENPLASITFITLSFITLTASAIMLLSPRNRETRKLISVFHLLNTYMLLIVILVMIFRN